MHYALYLYINVYNVEVRACFLVSLTEGVYKREECAECPPIRAERWSEPGSAERGAARWCLLLLLMLKGEILCSGGVFSLRRSRCNG